MFSGILLSTHVKYIMLGVSFLRECTIRFDISVLRILIECTYSVSYEKQSYFLYRIVPSGLERLHQNTTLRENVISNTHTVNQNFSAMLHLSAVYL